MKNLYIIGNGFDCHHGINSSYNAYRNWLEKNDSDLYERLREFYDVDNNDWWWEFELNLGNIDLKDYIQNIASENQPNFASDEFRDRDWYDGSYQAESEVGGLVNEIKNTFTEWVNSLPKADGNKKVKLIKEDSFFINFNYTSTLQDLYCIPNSEIFHIHGKIPNKTLILGHNKSYKDLLKTAESTQPKPPTGLSQKELCEWYIESEPTDDYITQTVREAAINEILAIRKNVKQIIQDNQATFSLMSGIEHIYIYGFSFSLVDQPYINEIINYIDKKKVWWTISYFSDDDKTRIEDYMQFHNLPPDLWELIKLEDIQRYKQPLLF